MAKWLPLLVLFCTTLAAPQAPTPQTCAMARKELVEQIGFLKQQQKLQVSDWDFECTTQVIRSMEYKNVPGSADVLIEYLDFRRPETDAEKHGFFFQPFRAATTWYPVMSPLFTFGKAVVPALIAAIKSAETSDVARRNAALTIADIYRDDVVLGIRLMRRSRSGATRDEKRRVDAAIREMLGRCFQNKKACQLAARS